MPIPDQESSKIEAWMERNPWSYWALVGVVGLWTVGWVMILLLWPA